MSYRILLTEDDKNLQEGIIDYYTGKREELLFTSAYSGPEALDQHGFHCGVKNGENGVTFYFTW